MDVSKLVEHFSSAGVNQSHLAILKKVKEYAGRGVAISGAINMPFVDSFLARSDINQNDFNEAKDWWVSLTDEERNQYE